MDTTVEIPEVDIPQTDNSNRAPEAMAQSLLDIMENFDALLKLETEYLTDGKLKEAAKLSHAKTNVSREYESLLKTLFSKRNILSELSNETLKNTLITKYEDFSHALKKNQYALKSAQISARKLAERIATAAREKLEPRSETYNAKGAINGKTPYEKLSAAVTDGAY